MIEIIAPILNFAVVIGILWYFGRKPFAAFLEARSSNIEKAISEAETEAVGADTVMKEWAGKWNGSKVHAKELMDETKKRMELFREKTIKMAGVEAERIKRDAKVVGQSEIAKARVALQKRIAIDSIDLAKEYVNQHLSEKDRQKLVTEYVEILGNGAAN